MTHFCPRCPEAPLSVRQRGGIEIDVCPSCRGVWLDRGELDKLIAQAGAELAQFDPRDREPPSSRRGSTGHYPRRKRGLLETFGDLFD
jgi:uncharacterized protein